MFEDIIKVYLDADIGKIQKLHKSLMTVMMMIVMITTHGVRFQEAY